MVGFFVEAGVRVVLEGRIKEPSTQKIEIARDRARAQSQARSTRRPSSRDRDARSRQDRDRCGLGRDRSIMITMKLCVATHHRDQIAINAIVISR